MRIPLTAAVVVQGPSYERAAEPRDGGGASWHLQGVSNSKLRIEN
jgi:hypothetical protein